MGKLLVRSWIDSHGRFHFNIPVDDMGEFQEELIRELEKIEPPVESSAVKRKGGIHFFEIATDLNKEQIETLVNQALIKIQKERR